jgi:hypothetical protein
MRYAVAVAALTFGQLLAVQKRLEIGKRRVGRTSWAALGIAAGCFQLPLVFIVVAIKAQQFPVAAIGRVVVVVVVSMMHRQLAQVGMREFAGTTAADPRIDLEGALPIALFALLGVAARVSHQPVEFARVVGIHVVFAVADGS